MFRNIQVFYLTSFAYYKIPRMTFMFFYSTNIHFNLQYFYPVTTIIIGYNVYLSSVVLFKNFHIIALAVNNVIDRHVTAADFIKDNIRFYHDKPVTVH